jgi:hypothetical protein
MASVPTSALPAAECLVPLLVLAGPSIQLTGYYFVKRRHDPALRLTTVLVCSVLALQLAHAAVVIQALLDVIAGDFGALFAAVYSEKLQLMLAVF